MNIKIKRTKQARDNFYTLINQPTLPSLRERLADYKINNKNTFSIDFKDYKELISFMDTIRDIIKVHDRDPFEYNDITFFLGHINYSVSLKIDSSYLIQYKKLPIIKVYSKDSFVGEVRIEDKVSKNIPLSPMRNYKLTIDISPKYPWGNIVYEVKKQLLEIMKMMK